jgi:DNA-binding transcriptional LysR family regulator
MNWDDLRYVLALAEAGSLAQAARDLKVDHTTVGRRIETVEAELGMKLFTRAASGYTLMSEASDVLSEIRRVESRVLAVERAAQGRGHALRGTVRVTVSEALGSRYVAPRLAPFTQRHPAISVNLKSSAHALDLARREADVAIRLFRSRHQYLVMKRVADLGYALYASHDYLDRRGLPSRAEDFKQHEFVVYDLPFPDPHEGTWLEMLARGGRVALSTNSTAASLGAAIGGSGIALLPRFLADPEPNLRRIVMPNEPTLPIWLTIHRDLQHSAPVRSVLDFLTEAFRADAAYLRYGSEKPPLQRAAVT